MITQGALAKPITAQAVQVSTASTCRSAIAKYWPAELQSTAVTILDHENHKESTAAINTANADGSVDYGCMQINSVHKSWVDLSKLTNPDYNAQVGYQIYRQQGVKAWYAVKGILWQPQK